MRYCNLPSRYQIPASACCWRTDVTRVRDWREGETHSGICAGWSARGLGWPWNKWRLGFISMQINIVIAAAKWKRARGLVCNLPRGVAVPRGGLAFRAFDIFICLQRSAKGESSSINFNTGVKLFKGLGRSRPPLHPVVLCSEVPGSQLQQVSVTANTLRGVI